MPEEILKNLYRLPIPLVGNPLKELNAYLIKGRDRNLLVDTGFRQPACREALFAQLGELGLGAGDVDVLLTHMHSDHSGLGPEVVADRGTILVSSTDRAILDDFDQRESHWVKTEERFFEEGFPPEQRQQMRSTNPAHSMAPPKGGRYESLEDGAVIEAGGYRFKALLMPGHTPGQMCFWMEDQGAMLLGDHVLFDITPNITAWNDLPDALGAYLKSLKKIREYDVALPLPGHRGRGDLRARVDRLIDHHARRLEECCEAVKNHPGQPAYVLAGYMSWKIRASSWEDFPITQKWFAVGECMSHLERLMAEGRIGKEIVDGKAAYYTI